MTASALTFGYAGCRVRVETTDPSALAWLKEFLGPDFDECPDGTPTHLVIFHAEAETFDGLRRRGPHASSQSIGVFALDTSMVTLPLWHAEGEEVLVFDSEGRTFFRKDQGVPRTEIISEPGNLAARTALLRVVREIVTAHIVADGGLVVHGAALEWYGRGYVIAGPKEAGKTTLLLHLLWRTGAAYVANDRSVVWPDRKPVTLRGLPTIVSVRASTAAHFPDLEAAFHGRKYHHRLSLEEAEKGHRPLSSAKQGRSSDLTPAQLGRLLETGRSAQLPLGALIFPRRTGLPGGATLERLAPDVTMSRLRLAMFRTGSPLLGGELFTTDGPPGPGDRREAACASLSRAIPAFDCVLGLDAYADPASASRMLASIEHEATESRSS